MEKKKKQHGESRYKDNTLEDEAHLSQLNISLLYYAKLEEDIWFDIRKEEVRHSMRSNMGE